MNHSNLYKKREKLENCYLDAVLKNNTLDIMFYTKRLHELDLTFNSLNLDFEPLILSSEFIKHSGEKTSLTTPPSRNLEKSRNNEVLENQILGLGGVLNAKN